MRFFPTFRSLAIITLTPYIGYNTHTKEKRTHEKVVQKMVPPNEKGLKSVNKMVYTITHRGAEKISAYKTVKSNMK